MSKILDKKLHKLKDQKEDLISLAQSGDGHAFEYIIVEYSGLVRFIASKYFLKGGEYEDLIQEGYIGLYKAILEYRDDKQASFSTFAQTCVKHEILGAVRRSLRKKHAPLNDYISLQKEIDDELSGDRLIEIISSSGDLDPEQKLILEERKNQFYGVIASLLTDLERDVLKLYLRGKSYDEIANLLKKNKKSVDNAMQRVKKKLQINLYRSK